MRRVLLLLPLACASCARCGGSTSAANDASTSATASDAGTARCAIVGAPTRFGAPSTVAAEPGALVPFAAEIGGVASDASAFFAGVRAAGEDGATSVLRLPFDGGAASTLVTTPNAAPRVARAPIVAIGANGEILVGAFVIDGEARTFHVAEAKSGALVDRASFPEELDESEAHAMIAAPDGKVAIAWDDADPTHARGRIRLGLFPGDAPMLAVAGDAGADAAPTADPSDVISPTTSDASWPRLVATDDPAHAVLLWLAERPDEDDRTDGAAGEPGQSDAYRWIEAVVVDLRAGKPLGVPRVLTSKDGHAQSFSAAIVGDALSLVARDDPRPTDGDGGALVVVRAKISLADGAIAEATSSVLVDDDVAPGVPLLVAHPPDSFIFHARTNGTMRVVPVADPSKASDESALDGTIVVSARGDRALAIRPAGAGLELSIAGCAFEK